MEVKMEYETAKAEGRGGPRWIVRSVLAALFAFCSVLVPGSFLSLFYRCWGEGDQGTPV